MRRKVFTSFVSTKVTRAQGNRLIELESEIL